MSNKKTKVLRDRHHSTTAIYPKLPKEIMDKINKDAIPTITIEVSQMIDETHAQLTDEQFDIIVNNGFIDTILPNGLVSGFIRFEYQYNNYMLVLCWGSSSEISYIRIYINSETKIAELSFGDISVGKQLYLHGVSIQIPNLANSYRLNYYSTNPDKVTGTLNDLRAAIIANLGNSIMLMKNTAPYETKYLYVLPEHFFTVNADGTITEFADTNFGTWSESTPIRIG